jgi:heptosyltransferase II
MSREQRILVISVSGIGNTILFTPFLGALRKHLPGARIDLLTLHRAMAEPVEGSALIDESIILPDSHCLLDILRCLRQLRAARYDWSVIAFPSNKWQFHLLAFLVGAGRRVAHTYSFGHLTSLQFLENRRIPAVEGLHDIDQNMNLLRAFDIDPADEERRPAFALAADDERFAEEYLQKTGLVGRPLVAIHPGAGGRWKDWQGMAKRWPAERFAALCDRLAGECGAHVLLFGGPEEEELKNSVKALAAQGAHCTLVSESLKRSAALIKRCRLMVSNDSGLMHVAAAVGVPTLGIFGPTNHTRTAPFGSSCRVVRGNRSCSPCLKYPFRGTSSKIHCQESVRCLQEIGADQVFGAASEMLSARNC